VQFHSRTKSVQTDICAKSTRQERITALDYDILLRHASWHFVASVMTKGDLLYAPCELMHVVTESNITSALAQIEIHLCTELSLHLSDSCLFATYRHSSDRNLPALMLLAQQPSAQSGVFVNNISLSVMVFALAVCRWCSRLDLNM
jgi:hypothetical protein